MKKWVVAAGTVFLVIALAIFIWAAWYVIGIPETHEEYRPGEIVYVSADAADSNVAAEHSDESSTDDTAAWSTAGEASHITVMAQNAAEILVTDMGAGINIGNALDSCDWDNKFYMDANTETYETIWGNPKITPGVFRLVSNAGFNTVRIPVTWMNHIDKDGNVDEAWLKRVGTVVSAALEQDLYVIIDIHHDTGNAGWIRASETNYSENEARVRNMITQIADYFKDYDQKLILEGFNEMVDEKSRWDKIPGYSYRAFNKWNQLFVDTVRATGGGNESRFLLVNLYSATPNDRNIAYFALPKDTIDGRLLVGVHIYSGPEGLDDVFDAVKTLRKSGYPVVVGEFGQVAKVKFDRVKYCEEFREKALEQNLSFIWWDNGGSAATAAGVKEYALIHRADNTWYFPEIAGAITDTEVVQPEPDDGAASDDNGDLMDQKELSGNNVILN